MIIERKLQARVRLALEERPAVALLGPRQVGKTTLAWALSEGRPSLYLDLENPQDLAKLDDPVAYLQGHADRLVVLDEVQRKPELFAVLRGLIDEGRRQGQRSGRFLLLGSASPELLRQSSESLAGRLAFLELGPVAPDEWAPVSLNALWSRGGFPEALLAPNDGASLRWRQDFIKSYLERDIPQLGPRIPAATLRRFWTMLAHQQGGLLNAADLARALGVDGKTVAHYLDVLVDVLVVRRLPPWHANAGKRLVRSPKVYVRDSGLVHALLGVGDEEALLGHPVSGGSWEGLAVEALVGACPAGAEAHFYRSAAGAEVDLLLSLPGGALWAVEVKRSSQPVVSKGFHIACQDVGATRRVVVHSGAESYPMAQGVEALTLPELATQLRSLSPEGGASPLGQGEA